MWLRRYESDVTTAASHNMEFKVTGCDVQLVCFYWLSMYTEASFLKTFVR